MTLDPAEHQDVPAGTVHEQDRNGPVTVLRDYDTLLIPAMRLDAANCELLRKILVGEALTLAVVHAEITEDEAERLAHAAWREGDDGA